ncbi:complex I subunit 4 family protein [Fulvivirga sedimenti]|uniref:NADH-quinone oxidoreductase subunit M n=1 Tax=Fulvivirga sedimenti TaxID=2879465 RepID=A0A9X1HTL6_9BACT|nr:NADH-quinone oxidoreductase subunit M [Fulvivirga sedimenti]MCA6075395.1 NADH-quinone oxidoreductase subunit M [Fulvivirga sedimenti]MCA6076572.1 NADH-quinone oxidoreductase subunit M [Fulvivirga sedimenti]MCA6077700.1 NADH-quinone oxidoreductase subunit M [Fulvivirga sedimenti]
MITDYLLSLLIFLPITASVVMLILPKEWDHSFKWIALVVSLLQAVLLIPVFNGFDPSLSDPGSMSGFQWLEYREWINLDLGNLGILSAHYFLGLDGLNVWMVVLSVLILLVSVIASWKVKDRRRGYFALFLLLNGAIIGCFTSLDFLLFYLFFEFMLLPMFFLIGLWGGPRKDYAAIKFFLYTLFGSVLILIVMIALYLSVIDPVSTAGELMVDAETVQILLKNGEIPANRIVHTFNMIFMTDPGNIIPGSLLDKFNETVFVGLSLRMWAFLLVFAGFAIKVPLVPVHTWLPDAHVEAPTAISVILAGVLLKVGGYGMIRAGYFIFPDGATHFAWLVALLGVISIIYGAMNALASKDLKRLVAYSSVSHMGFVALGIASNTAEGIGGAIYQLFSHGIISAALFILVGVIYDRTHDRSISNYSGLASKMPAFTVLSVLFFFASMGLPGMSGFIAEILVLLGAFASQLVNGFVSRTYAAIAVLGMILSAAYYLWTLQRMYFGEFFVRKSGASLPDLDRREYVMLIPLGILAIVLGIFPSLFLDWINPMINSMIDLISVHAKELLMTSRGV